MQSPVLLRRAGLALALLAAVSEAGASQLLDNLHAGKSQVLVLYGTSETQFGRWADVTPGHGGLADWLKAAYGDRVTVINSGMAGKGSNTGAANLEKGVLANRPDTVFLEFATNDANTGYAADVPDYGISLEKSRANLNAMIDRIVAANPKAEVFLLTMNPVVDMGTHNYGTLRPQLEAYFQIYRDVAAERGLPLIDTEAAWKKLLADDPAKFRSYLPEGLHPTAPGSLAVALPAIEAALGTPAPATPAP